MPLNVGLWKSKNHVPAKSDIDEVEKILGIQLPYSYIDLMKKWNGGYFPDEYQIVLKDNMPKELDYYLGSGFWSLSMLSGISSDIKNNQGIVCTAKSAHEWGIPERVLAFDGDGHTWVAFDYRDVSVDDDPRIIFIESDDLNWVTLADNFTEFQNLLVPSDQVYDYDGNVIYKK